MKIALFGSTGRVGSVVFQRAISEYEVNRLVRRGSGQDAPGTEIIGDVLNEGDVMKTIEGSEAVVSCLNTDKEDVLTKSMPILLKAMRSYGVKRIITCGTAGILQARSEDGLYRFQSSESKRRSTTAAEDHLRAFLMLQASEMDWTIVCPTYLPDGERIGNYRTERDVLPEGGSSISKYDTGDFIYKQLSDLSFIKSRVGICY
ncbi:MULTISPECIES: NAD(P)H-binding protein [unclassified Rossellomorea]|uniref:NAD(P)-dependent oxidoreductase n=1 Tax=unclassified Rossellomorea TaxID=2837526 RepID=UPI0020C6998D|nr:MULTISPECIES: NAD(P)H-binding protein [unclassified Rossellomorea]UTE79000.1 NAD(P)H-binding protein [Rossellomorea sp. KS-H15a]WGG47062.1 NAD(P)H-binding protein [Rossellomorea sp. DA94]